MVFIWEEVTHGMVWKCTVYVQFLYYYYSTTSASSPISLIILELRESAHL